MKNSRSITSCALGLALLAGCASSEVTQRQSLAAQEMIDRPGRIIVYDFSATPADIPATAAITGYYDERDTVQSTEEIELGRQLGALAADKLVGKILDTGMPAQRAGDGPAPVVGDVLITGQFISIDEGDRKKRIIIGFGKGSAELITHVEGYLVTQTGHRQLGTLQVQTGGGKAPGLAVSGILTVATASPVGLIVNSALTLKGETGSETLEAAAERTADQIAEELRVIFVEKGWI